MSIWHTRLWHTRLPAGKRGHGARAALGLAVAAALLAASVAIPATPAAAWTVPPAPTLVDVNPSGNAGDYLIGAIPPNYDPSKPVIVFVQGLHGSAQNWWGPTAYYGDNDMYAYAYNNGFRTAFVQFRDADGNAGSMWLNGSTLRTQLEAICRYFGVSKVNIVAHSKGGVDSQSAIVHYGAYPYVQNVFTLATPHRGSELADLCYSWWAWWLAALLGQRDDGTYVMQTSYMDYFRSITNNRPEDANIRYYTGAGLDWGPWFSAMWFGGNYLWWYDDNDGVVCLYSAHGLPNGTRVFTDGYLNHDNIRMGSKSWKYIAPYISYYRTATAATPNTDVVSGPTVTGGINVASTAMPVLALGLPSTAVGGPAADRPASMLVRGGSFDGQAVVTFPVESGVSRFDVSCLVGGAKTTGALVAPDGNRVALSAGGAGAVDPSAAGEVFGGAHALGASIEGPQTGLWTLELSTPGSDAYLALVGFEGGAKISLTSSPKAVYAPGERVSLSVLAASGLNGQPLAGLKVDGVAVVTSPERGHGPAAGPDYGLAARLRLEPVAGVAGTYEGGFRLPGREGVYNLTIDISGTEVDGTSVQRTVVLSVIVLEPAHRNVEGLRGLVQGK